MWKPQIWRGSCISAAEVHTLHALQIKLSDVLRYQHPVTAGVWGGDGWVEVKQHTKNIKNS